MRLGIGGAVTVAVTWVLVAPCVWASSAPSKGRILWQYETGG